MIRIFQTGDNHIGIRYTRHEEKDRLKKARMDSLRRCVEAANANACNIFAVTGDLFESAKGIPQRDIRTVAEILSEFNGEAVFILPGNHDYYDGSTEVWELFSEYIKGNEKIILITKYRPYTLDIGDERVTIYPAFCDMLHSEENRLQWIRKHDPAEDDTDYRIGMAHGAIEGLSPDAEGRYFLMTEKELEELSVDVWLIGHTHVEYPRELPEEAFTAGYKIFNAGTHCQTDVSNNTEGCGFIIELDRKEVRAKKVCTGTLRFYRREIAAAPAADGMPSLERQLTEQLSDLGNRSVVELTLSGSAVVEDYEQRGDIYNRVLERFTESVVNDAELSTALTAELIRAEYSEASLPAKLLTELLSDPREAQLAYDLIKTLKL